MAIITDVNVLNQADDSADWTASGFDSPTLNDSASTQTLYIEGTSCMWWPLKKGVTNGYLYDPIISSGLTGQIMVAWLNYSLSSIAAIPINNIYIRVSSSSTFTTDYGQWDAKSQFSLPKNTPISGHVPIMIYPTNPDSTNGTPNYSSLQSIGWVATTGNTADGKDGGFDMFLIISWIGAHSATYSGTYFSSMYTDATPSTIPGTTNRPLGILSRSGNFYQTNINFQLGHGTSDTANVIVTESGKTIYFANIEPEQNLGYIFVDPASTHEIQFTLTDCVHFWNEQNGTTPRIFTNPNNATYLKIDGCSFSKGGQIDLPSYSVNRWVKTCKFDDCGFVDLGDCTFEDNTIVGATLGSKYIGSTDTRRCKNTAYNNCTTAIEFDTVGNYEIDGDIFSGNTYDIENSQNVSIVNATTIVSGNAYKIVTVGTTDYTTIGSPDNVIGTKFVATGIPTGTGTVTRVLYIEAKNGANPSGAKVNNTGTNADTIIDNPVTHTLTGIVQNSEVTYVKRGTNIDTGSDGSSTTGSRNFVTTNAWVVNAYKGHLLEITSGSDIGRYYVYGNNATTLYLDTQLTTTAGTLNWELYDENDDIIVHHIENIISSGESSFNYNYVTDYYIDIIIMHIDYQDVVIPNVLLPNSNASVPIQQILDQNYYNP